MQHTTRHRPTGFCLAVAAGILAGALNAQKTPDEALRALQEGNRRFASDKAVPQPLGEGVRRTLARGQSPFAIVLACADSRVAPEHLFNAGLGELFVIRVAGNTTDPEVLASIEYAVEHLQTSLCVVLGHEGCGAIAASVAQVTALEHNHAEAAPSPAMQSLLERIEPAVRRARARELGGKELFLACEEENVHLTVTECMRRSALLRRYAQTGKFRMVPARYHLGSGEVEWLSPRPLPPEQKPQVEVAQHVVPMGVPPHVALRLLQAGHRRFLGDGLPAGDLSATRREALTHGQRPLAIVLTCADSRVPPEHLFDAGLGELFVVRVAGNTLNDDVLASIEYAAAHTGTSLLVVMGHSRCGAISAAADIGKAHGGTDTLTPSMRALLTRLEPAVEKARATGARDQQLIDLAVRGNVLRTIAEARARSAILRQLEGEGRFAILATVYDIGSGDLTWLKEPSFAEAMPPAAPGGESKANSPGSGTSDHGADAHGADPHDAGDHGNDAHGGHGTTPPPAAKPAKPKSKPDSKHGTKNGADHSSKSEGHETTHDATALDWSIQDVHVRVPSPHGTAHGEHSSGHEPASATDEHGHADEAHGHEAGADPHGHDEAHSDPQRERTDPIPLLGIVGISSLLLAGMIALTSKR